MKHLPMPSPRAEFSWRTIRLAAPVVVFAFAPKCLACVLAYAGLGAGLGFGGAEICGVATDGSPYWPGLVAGCGGAAMVGWLLIRMRKGVAGRRDNEGA